MKLYGYRRYPLARLRGPPDEGLAFLLLLPPLLPLPLPLLGRPTLPLKALFDLAAVTSEASRPLADFFGLEARKTADRSPPLIVVSNTHIHTCIHSSIHTHNQVFQYIHYIWIQILQALSYIHTYITISAEVSCHIYRVLIITDLNPGRSRFRCEGPRVWSRWFSGRKTEKTANCCPTADPLVATSTWPPLSAECYIHTYIHTYIYTYIRTIHITYTYVNMVSSSTKKHSYGHTYSH